MKFYKNKEESVTIFNENCLNVMDLMIEKNIKVDCIITDPPYKLTSRGTSGTMGGEFWTSDLAKNGKVFKKGYLDIKDWIDKCFEVLKDGTHIYIMTNDKNLREYLNALHNSEFKYIKTIIWDKPNKICGRWYMTKKETIILARKGKQRPINNAGTPDVLQTPTFKKQKIKIVKNGKVKNKNLHDTEKPVELMKTLIENSTNKDETVLDLFMGIGTTGVACKSLDRKFIGIELDEGYYNIAKKRIEEEL